MVKGLIEAMTLDITRGINASERSDTGMLVDSQFNYNECVRVQEIYDWSVEKQMRKLNWKDLKQTRIFIKEPKG